MKQTTYLLLFLIFLIHSEIAHSQFLPFTENKNSSNALAMMSLKGKVKSMEQIPYKAVDNGGVIQKGENIFNSFSVNADCIIKFDTASRIITENYLTAKSVRDILVTHKYNTKPNTELIEQSYLPGKEPTFKCVYKYNDKGKMIEENTTQFFKDNSSPWNTRINFKYDEKENLSESTVYKLNGTPELETKTIYKYNSKGNKLSYEVYNEKNELWFKETFKSDDNGNMIEHDYYSQGGKSIDHSFILKYDANNNVIEKQYYQPADKLAKTFSYKYEYDKTGNWIKRVDLEDGKATFVLERKLEYY